MSPIFNSLLFMGFLALASGGLSLELPGSRGENRGFQKDLQCPDFFAPPGEVSPGRRKSQARVSLLRKLGRLVLRRREIHFDSQLFLKKKAQFSNQKQRGEGWEGASGEGRERATPSPVEIFGEELDSPEAILAYIEWTSQVAKKDLIDLIHLQFTHPPAFQKVLRRTEKIRKNLKNGVTEGSLQKLFSEIYWSVHHVQYPNLLLEVDWKYKFLPVHISLQKREKFQGALEELIRLRVEFALGQHNLSRAFEDLGLLRKSTGENIHGKDFLEKTFSSRNPALELVLWGPKILSNMLFGFQYRHYFHRLLTSPAFIRVPNYGQELLERGWEAIGDRAYGDYRHLLAIEWGLEKLKSTTFLLFRGFLFYMTAYMLNVVALDQGLVEHLYIASFHQIPLYWDPVYGDFDIFPQIYEFVKSDFVEKCDLSAQCRGEFEIPPGEILELKHLENRQILTEPMQRIFVEVYGELYEKLPKMYPSDKSALRDLVMGVVQKSLEVCHPNCSLGELQAIYSEIPDVLSRQMTELDRAAFVEQLAPQGTEP